LRLIISGKSFFEILRDLLILMYRLLMIPYYEADLLYRVMDNRKERVKLAETFFLEYLKLMNHYGMLD
jgi:hypothetical protein